MANLDEVVREARLSLDAIPNDASDRSKRLNHLALCLCQRYMRGKADRDIVEALELGRTAIETSFDDPKRAFTFHTLSIALDTRYLITRAEDDLDESIKYARKAVDAGHDDPDLSDYLDALASRLGKEYRRSGNIAILNEAIRVSREAVDAASDEPGIALFSTSLAELLDHRYTRTKQVADLEECVRITREALKAAPDDLDRYFFVLQLSKALCNRYRNTKVDADIEEATQLARECVERDSEDWRAMHSHQLSVCLGNRYSQQGKMADLNESIQLAKYASYSPSSNPSVDKSVRLSHLGVRLNQRYLVTGEMFDLDQAIRATRESIAQKPNHHLFQPQQLNNLSILLADRYIRTKALDDIEAAVQLVKRAIELTPNDHPILITLMSNLGLWLMERYSRTSEMKDLEEAVGMARETVKAARNDDPKIASLFHNLAFILLARYWATKSRADLEDSIQAAQKAVDMTPVGHPGRPTRLNNLGLCIANRFPLTEAIADLDAAIEAFRQAVDTASINDRKRTVYLSNLGDQLSERYNVSHARVDRSESLTCSGLVLHHENASITIRIRAGLFILQSAGDAEMAYEGATFAMSLLPKLEVQSLRNSDKQFVAGEVSGLASGAAALTLYLKDDPFSALEFLETGRNVLGASLERRWVDITELRHSYPEHAEIFSRLRDRLGAPTTISLSPEATSWLSDDTRGNQIYDTGRSFDEVVLQIRKLPGFDSFLSSMTKLEIEAAAIYGPIVIINISDLRCDALLVEQHNIRALNLSRLSKKDIEYKVERDDLGSSQTLEWLWDTIAAPILDKLGFDQPPSTDDWPHVWWIPTGLLSRFPLHAAGYHLSTNSVLDRVISSYSSSIKTIVRNRDHNSVQPPTSNKALLVGMDSTPDTSPLSFASKEVSLVYEVCTAMGLHPIEPERNKQAVALSLMECKVFHFAGHGYTNFYDPSQSHLRLEDWKVSPLSVADLLEMNLHKSAPFLAYLSACGTNNVKDEKYMDENIHLMNACQLAGFRHVIGTLWEVNDEVCVDIARIIYNEIRDGYMSDQSVSRGLHKAIKGLRDRWRDEPTKADNRGIAKRGDGSLRTNSEEEALDTREGSQESQRLPREIDIYEDDENDEEGNPRGPPPWVPFVHSGG